ncbi:flagellar basal body-associated FliL family protein [Profundibacterium mesophilum]|uniref:Flagellar protein FliL n=1 Tax=Profundibacterium mesophilum KAUST100406-0324 TaxID=1037889 RepID=A0A921NR50_9RHOB|nr:flagellar basal body-associated FliL family protein [Profundibacterium mesophilum]KAF0674629.1 Flagellar FliL protein [Profundibacterium mesophilum KAUST100406-0324]
MAQTTMDAPPPKVSAGRKLMMLALVLLISGAAAIGGLTVSMGLDGVTALFTGAPMPEAQIVEAELVEGVEEEGAAAAESGYDKTAPVSEKVAMPFKEIIVNITSITATGRRTSRFLKINIALVYDNGAEGASNIEPRRLHLRDSFQDYLRLLTERDLQGSIGLVTLKTELLRRARAITESDAPQEILIADLIIQ